MAQKSHLQVFTEELRKLLQIEKAKEQQTPEQLGIRLILVDAPERFEKLTFLPHVDSGSFISKDGNLLFYVKFY